MTLSYFLPYQFASSWTIPQMGGSPRRRCSSVLRRWDISHKPFYRLDKCTICKYIHPSETWFAHVFLRVAAGGNFAILAVVLNHRIPVAIRAVLTVPNVALQNAIACRVFRHLRLGYIKRSPDRFRSSASVTPNVNHPINFMSPSSLATLNVSISGPTDDTYPPQHSAAICDNQGSSLGGVRREQGNKPDPFSSGQSADSRV